MKRASHALNVDALETVVEHYERAAYDIPRRDGLYRHRRTGAYYIRRDAWTRDNVKGDTYRAQWYAVDHEEAKEAQPILETWNAGIQPPPPITSAEAWDWFVDDLKGDI